MTVVVEAKGLTKSYGQRQVVKGIDFSVTAGRCFGFLGPNGAGKTTTLRMIQGISPFDAGSLRVFDYDLPRDGRLVRARIGVVPQADNLDPDFTVVENLRIYGGYFDLPKAELEPRIEELLNFAALSDRAGSRIDALSGGMKRRLTIARALVNDPALIILDEPTTGLDPQARHMIWGRLRALIQQGKTLLLTTHYMEEAERLCDELVIMDHGRILAQGSPAALVKRHVEPEVLELRGAAQAAAEGFADLPDCRLENVGDTIYCYAQDTTGMVKRLEDQPDLAFVRRPAGLEDVFLRLTGRDLRD